MIASRWHRGARLLMLAGVGLAYLHPVQATSGGGPAPRQAHTGEQGQTASTVLVDAKVFGPAHRPVLDLGATAFRVTIDREPREVRSVRYVHRGPGAEAAARAAAAPGQAIGVAAEPFRVVILAADESSILRGSEKPVLQAAWRVLDLLGATDHAAALTLPTPRGQTALSTERQVLRDVLGHIVGQGSRPDLMARRDDQQSDDLELLRRDEESNRERPPGQTVDARTPGSERGAPAADEAGDAGPRLNASQALSRVMASLRTVPGPKAVIVLSGGMRASDGASPAAQAALGRDTLALEAAAAARATLHVVTLARPGGLRADGADIESAAIATGGLVIRASEGTREFERLAAVLSGGYLLEVAGRPSDSDGQSHALEVGVARADCQVFAPRRWVRRDDPAPPMVELAAVTDETSEAATHQAGKAPSTTGLAAGGAPRAAEAGSAAARAPRAARKRDPELEAVLARVSDYLEGYLRDFANVVAEEEYLQRVLGPSPSAPVEVRRLKSDLLLVRVPGQDGWAPFRDVFDVDGRPVRDREERLRKLFVERSPEAAMDEARRIAEEGARYNIGSVFRTVNLPTLPLLFLMPGRVQGFVFERHGEETVEGTRTWRLDYEEVGRPTLIRHAGTFLDIPASGSIWVDPLTGLIVKTRVRTSGESLRTDTTVIYRRSDTLGFWTPAEMTEEYSLRSQVIEGKAIYRNFRRFQVSTDVEVKPAKKEGP